MIELVDVSAGYRNRDVIRHVNLEILPGQTTSIIGINGCGKSTLLKTIARQILPRSGTVRFDGVDIGRYESRALARKLSYLPQVKTPPAITVQTLVMHGRFPHLPFPRHPSTRDLDIAQTAMCEAGIADLRYKNIHELSGGEQQKAYIAMALAQDAEAILLDEPTTYLDVNQQQDIYRLIQKLNGLGKTIVMVVHDLPAAFAHSDRICLLSAGCVMMHDVPDAVIASGKIEQVFRVRYMQWMAPDNKPRYFLV